MTSACYFPLLGHRSTMEDFIFQSPVEKHSPRTDDGWTTERTNRGSDARKTNECAPFLDWPWGHCCAEEKQVGPHHRYKFSSKHLEVFSRHTKEGYISIAKESDPVSVLWSRALGEDIINHLCWNQLAFPPVSFYSSFPGDILCNYHRNLCQVGHPCYWEKDFLRDHSVVLIDSFI